MSILTPHRQGDWWKGHLWIYRDPATGAPYDLTNHRFDLHFRLRPDSDVLGWGLSTEGDDPDLLLQDGDGSEVTLPDGTSYILEPVGYPYVLRIRPQVPPSEITSAQWSWDLQHCYPGVEPETEDEGRWSVKGDTTRPVL